jgi:hypothetical protein
MRMALGLPGQSGGIARDPPAKIARRHLIKTVIA